MYYGDVGLRFLEAAARHLNRNAGEGVTFTVKQLQNKTDYIERTYKEVHDQMKASGFGRLEWDQEPSLKATIRKRFKHFFLVQEFLGKRANVEPPLLIEAGGVSDDDSAIKNGDKHDAPSMTERKAVRFEKRTDIYQA